MWEKTPISRYCLRPSGPSNMIPGLTIALPIQSCVETSMNSAGVSRMFFISD
jgi:hypothetical protein